MRASFRLARASADAYRRLLTRRADLNQQGWAAIDSPAASRIRIANRGHRRGRQFAGKPSHCKRNRRHFPNTMTCHLACWQLDANQLSSGGDAKIHQAAERDKRLKSAEVPMKPLALRQPRLRTCITLTRCRHLRSMGR